MHAFKSASELRHLLRSKKVTARDLLEEYLARVDRYDVELNAIVWQDRAKARQVADAIGPERSAELQRRLRTNEQSVEHLAHTWRLIGRRLQDLRVAVWATDEMSPVGTDALAAVDAVKQACKDAGAKVDDSARPAFTSRESGSLYSRLMLSFGGAVVPEAQYDQLRARANALAADDQSEGAAMLRARVLNHRDWVVLSNERERLRWAWHEFFNQFDIVIAPIAATAAFPHDHSPIQARTILVDNQPRPYFDPLFWGGLFGVAYLPATAIPVTRSSEGLPLGVQIVGPAYGDRITIGVAQLLEDAGFRFSPPPGYET